MRMNKSWGQYLILLILTMAVLAMAGCGGGEEQQQAAAESQITVETVLAQTQDISKSASYTGLVAGKNEVDVLAEAAAKVTSVYVQPGDYVSAGQTIATLDTKDYVNSVALAENSYQQALAGKKTNDVNLQTAQNNLERIRKLFDSGSATQLELENAQAAVDLLSTGSADVAVEIAATNLQNAQNQLAKCTITAPISGTVGDVAVTVGQMIGTGSKVAVITDASNLEVEISVSESDISYIQKGNAVQVYIKAAQDDAFSGVVDSIAAVTESGKSGYCVKIDLSNVNGKIKSGMFAEVVLNTQSSYQTLALPVNAVITKAGQSVVYVPNEEGRAHQIEVTTGISGKEYIEITGGIEAGQEVITSGNTLVSEGTKIKIVNEEAE